MFGRATIKLGIGPHSSQYLCEQYFVLLGVCLACLLMLISMHGCVYVFCDAVTLLSEILLF